MDNTNQTLPPESINEELPTVPNQSVGPQQPTLPSKPPNKSRRLLLILVLGAFLFLGLSIASWFVFNKSSKQHADLQPTEAQINSAGCDMDKLTLQEPTEEEIKENPWLKLTQSAESRQHFEDAHNNNPAFKVANEFCKNMQAKGYEIFAQYNGAADGFDNTNAYFSYFFKKQGSLNDIKDEVSGLLKTQNYSSINAKQEQCIVNEAYKNAVHNLKTRADIDNYAKSINKFYQDIYVGRCTLYHGSAPYWSVTANSSENDTLTGTVSNLTYPPRDIATAEEISNGSWQEKTITDGKTVVVLSWSYHANPVL